MITDTTRETRVVIGTLKSDETEIETRAKKSPRFFDPSFPLASEGYKRVSILREISGETHDNLLRLSFVISSLLYDAQNDSMRI
jgi:hypothetical protein